MLLEPGLARALGTGCRRSVIQDYDAEVEGDREQQLDLNRILEMVRRRRWWMLAGFCIALVPGLWQAITPQPTFQAVAKISVTRDEMRVFVQRVRKIKELQGSYEKKVTPIELTTGHLVSFRRGVYAARDLEAGTVLERDDLTSLRPNVGIDGREYFKVLGRRLRVDKKSLQRLDWDDLEP